MSLRREGWTHKLVLLTSQRFIEAPVPSQDSERTKF